MKKDENEHGTGKCLFIVALPPPFTGQGLSSQKFLDSMSSDYDVRVVRMNKGTLASGFALGRCREVLGVLREVFRLRKEAEFIYLTISESIAGNLKDIAIFSLCLGRLRRFVIHLQGGAGMARIMTGRCFPLQMANHFFWRRIGAVVVEGATQARTFSEAVSPEKLHVVNNFAAPEAFISEESLARKYSSMKPLRILFLSNLIYGKGHIELLAAFRSLREVFGDAVTLDVAGAVDAGAGGDSIVAELKRTAGVTFHGPMSGAAKVRLLHEAHIFCLPTYYPYEGQPLSIIEAYAAGCVVVTTYHSGIPDIFTDGVNGYRVDAKSTRSLVEVLTTAIRAGRESMMGVGASNRATAEKRFQLCEFTDRLRAIAVNTGVTAVKDWK